MDIYRFANHFEGPWSYILGLTITGMAIRIAYNLGLNHDCTNWVDQGKMTEEEAEIRKITWWGCFLLDKFVLHFCTFPLA